MKKNEKRRAFASFILGTLSMVMWVLPVVGVCTSILGISLGISVKSSHQRVAVTGILLSTIGLLLTLINAFFGGYIASKGMLGWGL